jgi:hypothetical protein
MLKHPVHTLIIVVRITLLTTGVVLYLVPIKPAIFLVIQAGLSILQCILLYMQEYRYKITTDRQHPLTGMPKALHSLRQESHMQRLMAGKRAAEAVAESKGLRKRSNSSKSYRHSRPPGTCDNLGDLADMQRVVSGSVKV